MHATIKGIKIRGICTTVPDNVCQFEDDLKFFPFPEKSSKRLGRVMGFKEHRISDPSSSPCDFASYTMNYLFQHGMVKKEDIQALVVVAQMQDHPVPGNSKVIHGQLGLDNSVFCTDIYENCIGFISGLFTSCSYIASGAFEEVALITTDVSACRANKLDRNTYPLCGDAAAVILISKSENSHDEISFVFHTFGELRNALLVPAGGCRMPATPETAKLIKDDMGNFRSLNSMHMDGTAVFQFVMEKVPPLIEEICLYAGISKDKIEFHLTHQPNRFMLEKLADLMGVSKNILFNNIGEFFGNSSPVTIPLDIAYNLGETLLTQKHLVCFSSFGAGLSLAAAVCELGNLDFCELIEHPGNGATIPPQCPGRVKKDQ